MMKLKKVSKRYMNSIESYAMCMCIKAACSCSSCQCPCSCVSTELSATNSHLGYDNVHNSTLYSINYRSENRIR